MLEMTFHRVPTLKMFLFCPFLVYGLCLLILSFSLRQKGYLQITTFLTTVHALIEFADDERGLVYKVNLRNDMLSSSAFLAKTFSCFCLNFSQLL